MNNDFRRERIGKEIYLSSICDPKFKNNRISVNLIVPLTLDMVTENAIVPLVLKKGYRDCPDFTKLNYRLNELYGAYVDGEIRKIGESQIINLSITGIDNRFALEKEDITLALTDMICGLLLDPVLEDGVFAQKSFALEKQFLIDTIESELNDKVKLAQSRCEAIMCEGEPYSISKFGVLDRARALTPKMATDAYYALLKKAKIEIIFVGSGDSSAAGHVFAKAFANRNRSDIYENQIHVKRIADNVKDVTEKYDITQGKLAMGFRTGVAMPDKDVAATRMMSALYGATPFSRLFINVREKLSLCYYCRSAYDRFKGIMMVNSGIEAENKKKAQAAILAQLEVLQRGEFVREEFDNTKKSLINAFKSVSDSVGDLENYYLPQIYGGKIVTPAQELENIQQVTMQDIVDTARKVTLDTVYFMAPKGGR